MKVLCINSCASPDLSLVAGQEYDLTAEQIKAVGAGQVEEIKTTVPPVKEPKPRKGK